MKLWQDAQQLQYLFLEYGLDDEMDNGENIVDSYDKLQEIVSDVVGNKLKRSWLVWGSRNLCRDSPQNISVEVGV